MIYICDKMLVAQAFIHEPINYIISTCPESSFLIGFYFLVYFTEFLYYFIKTKRI